MPIDTEKIEGYRCVFSLYKGPANNEILSVFVKIK